MKDIKLMDPALTEGVKSSIVTDLYKRINDLHTQLTQAEANRYVLDEKLEDIKSVVQSAEPHVRGTQALFARLQNILKIEDGSTPTRPSLLAPVPQVTAVSDILRTQNATSVAEKAELQHDKQYGPDCRSKDLDLDERVTVIYGSDSPSRAGSPIHNPNTQMEHSSSVNVAEKYAFHPPHSVVTDAPGEPLYSPLGSMAKGFTNATPMVKDKQDRSRSAFGVDGKAVADSYLQRFISTSPRPQNILGGLSIANVLSPSHETDASREKFRQNFEVAKPKASVTDQLAEILGTTLEEYKPPVPNRNFSSSVERPAAFNLTVHTRLPEDFDHGGTYGATFYSDEEVCPKGSYNPEDIPVIRMMAIPRNVSINDVLATVAGGPIYRIGVKENHNIMDTNDVMIIFVHRSHALRFLKYTDENRGVYIKGCKLRTKVERDWESSDHRLHHQTFRKIMTDNVTRILRIRGLAKNFWNEEKLRELIIVVCDKQRVENPSKWRFRDPLSQKTDIYDVQIKSTEKGIEVVATMRSLSLGIMAKEALHGLKQPEGYFAEQSMGEHGPPIGPKDDPLTVPQLFTEYLRDPCDRPLPGTCHT